MSLTLPPLPFALDALAPWLSREALSLHHGRHHAGYVETTVKLVRGTPLESAPLERIVRLSAVDPDRRLFHASAQAWNHEFFWNSLKPGGGGEPRGLLADRIRDSFGSHASFCEAFIKAATAHFGSGWAWLVLDGGALRVETTANADSFADSPHRALLTLDLWEHSYYPDYQNRRLEYVAAYLSHLVNWEFAARNLEKGAPASACAATSSSPARTPASARRS